MARINSLLAIVVEQGANELRLGADQEPKMLAFGSLRKLSLPKMSADTVRDLLGEIVTPESDTALRDGRKVETTYDAGSIGAFSVTLSPHAGGIAAVFVRARAATKVEAPSRESPERTEPSGVAASEPEVSTDRASSLLAELVARATALRATDVHLADGEAALARIDGALQPFGDSPPVRETLGVTPDVLSRGSLETAFDVPHVGRVRVHAYMTATGPAMAIRLLPPVAPPFHTLNMPVPFDDLVMSPHGLVLVCGASGSGKSTTLAALAQEAIQKRSVVLVTLEDPIEYTLRPSRASIVRRRQVGRDVADFATGLRDALREDPDILLVGEMRDAETIALALTAAETGHLVLASIHSRGAASAIERIVDAYGDARQSQIRAQLAESLRAVVGQRLVARARGDGRLPAIEILRANHAVASLIREGRTAQVATAIQSGRREGMLSLERCLADRVSAGEITLVEAKRAANDLDSLTSYLTKPS